MQGNTLKPEEKLPEGFSDLELAAWLCLHHSNESRVAYAHANYLFKVFEVCSKPTPLFIGDLGAETVKTLKLLSKSKLLQRIELPFKELDNIYTSKPDWVLLEAQVRDITDLKASRDKLFLKGRGKAISNHTAAMVWHDAAGRCMYRGCGQDLGSTPLTTKIARVAYLAHIVASDPDGPRGNEHSHNSSDDPENIMLMCDAHHRLVDRIDVNKHSVSYLKQMREDHTVRVAKLLDSLRYPTAQIITLLADLAQIPTNVSLAELRESVLRRELSPLPEIRHMIRRTQRDDRGRHGFWGHFLHEHESDIRELIAFTSNKPSQSSVISPDYLAIFPLHLVPVLVLSGRVIGEARNIQLFQYDRERSSWQWQNQDLNITSTFDISYEVANPNNSTETILSLELTATLDMRSLPEVLVKAIQEKKIGWVRITNSNPNPNCIHSQERLESFSSLARQAINTIQDSWRSKMIHVFGVSPASSLFKFGQMLQAGNHSTYRVYDRPDGSKPFVPALDITGNEVLSVDFESELQHSISLR